MTVLLWAVTVLNVVLIAGYIWVLGSLHRLDSAHRPDVLVYSRTGEVIDVQPVEPPAED